MSDEKRALDFTSIKAYLLNSEFKPAHRFFEQFSDMDDTGWTDFYAIWSEASLERKLEFLDGLEETAAGDTLVSYESLGMHLLHEPEGVIRKAAIELLWECEDYIFANELFILARTDPDFSVQTAAIRALGTFVYLGELDKFSARKKEAIETYLLDVLQGDHPDYKKQRALESLGYSSREDLPRLIQHAVDRNDPDWLLAALCAMGRSADEQWEPRILEALDHPDSDIQIEAIRAAGELELSSAVEFLVTLIEETDEIDYELYTTTIWSLSQIGGSQAIELINTLLENTDNEEEILFLESALDNLELKQGIDLEDFLTFDPSEDKIHTVSLDEEEGEDDFDLLEEEDSD
jgi:hypothetical protein